MEGFEIRFADTGHPQIYDNVGSIEMLQQMIFKDYKIEKNNQRLFTKKGLIITAANKIELLTDMKKTFVSGEVDDNKQKFKEEKRGIYLFNHKELLKNTSTIDETNRAQYLLESKTIIEKRHENSKDLRYGCYQMVPIEEKFDSDKINKIVAYYPQTAILFSNWYKYACEMYMMWHNFTQNQICFDEYIEKWENQRKALNVLTKNLEVACTDKKNTLVRLTNSLQVAKNRMKEERNNMELNPSRKVMLQQYSIQFQGIESALDQANKKTKSLENHLAAIFTKVRGYKNLIKQTHEELEVSLKRIDDYKRKKGKQLEMISNRGKEAYILVCEGASEKLERGNDSKLVSIIAQQHQIQDSLKKALQTITDAIVENQSKFAELYCLYLNHIQTVKIEYKKHYELHYEIEEVLKLSLVKHQKHLQSLHKQVDELIKGISKGSMTASLSASQSLITPLLTPIPSQILASSRPNQIEAINLPVSQPDKRTQLATFQQVEQKRRNHFNSKLVVLHEQIKELLKEEENNRKRSLAEAIALDDMYDNEILCNTRVPCFLINYDECTDKELVSKLKSSSSRDAISNRENMNGFDGIDIQLYKEGKGMDRILKQLEIIKNCQTSLKTESSSSSLSSPLEHKLKCMQVLLQKSSDIFHNIYQTKLAHITKNHEHALKLQQNHTALLGKQNKQLREQIVRYGQSVVDINSKMGDLTRQNAEIKNETIKSLKEIQQSKQKLQNELSEATKQCKNYEATIEENRKEIAKLRGQKRQMEDHIAKQVTGTMETLYLELEKLTVTIKQLEQTNHEYKIVMGDQAVKIATLETQLLVLKGQTDQGIQSSSQKDKLYNSFYGEAIRKQLPSAMQNSENSSSQINQSESQNQQKELVNPIEVPLVKKSSKSITTQELKEIQREICKYEKEIEQLKAQNNELREENTGLSQEIMKIAMRDTEDIEVQTDVQSIKTNEQQEIAQLSNQAQEANAMAVTNLLHSHKQHIKIEGNPQIGELRIFIPFNPGAYVSIKSTPLSQHTLHFSSGSATSPTLMNVNSLMQDQNWPYLLDMNCLSSKARELLTECTLVVVVRVTKVLEAEGLMKYYVEGDIINAIGFEDDDMLIKDYGFLLR